MDSSDTSAPLEPSAHAATSDNSTLPRKKNRILAAFVSAIVPGSGHLLRRDHLRAAIYLPAYLGVLLGVCLSRAFSTYVGCIGSIWIILVLTVVASTSALLSPRRSTQNLGWRFKLWAVPAAILSLLLASIVVNLCLRLSGFRAFTVPSISMEPAVKSGSRLMVDERFYKHHLPSRGDVICYRSGSTYAMKRVIAVGGDSIRGEDGRIYLNGKAIEEPYADFSGSSSGPADRSFGLRIVPTNRLFVMGDNRDFSFDSRLAKHGHVNVSDVTGRALYAFSLDGENSTLTAPKKPAIVFVTAALGCEPF
jgi:signal peptidase I